MERLVFDPLNGRKVVRNSRFPATAMPPCPSLSRSVFQRMFLSVATLQVTGASATSTRNVPSGPPAAGQASAVWGPVPAAPAPPPEPAALPPAAAPPR